MPGLDIHQEVIRYPIQGLDIEDLRRELGRHRRSGTGNASHGRTRSDITLRYELSGDGPGCEAVDVRIGVEVTTILPEWNPPREAAPGLLERWNGALRALDVHEAVHREHALQAAHDLRSRLAGVGRRPDCHALRRAVERHVIAVKLKCEFRDARFDARTRNGTAQGAVL